jgi:hypothetical protein
VNCALVAAVFSVLSVVALGPTDMACQNTDGFCVGETGTSVVTVLGCAKDVFSPSSANLKLSLPDSETIEFL